MDGRVVLGQVVPLLEQRGHTVVALDLPGYGGDHTSPRDVTLQSYGDRVAQVLDAQSERVILVGHSRGGIVITQTAEARPDKIETLVYLSAFLPGDGESLLQLAQQDRETHIFAHLTFAEDQGYVAFADDAAAIKDIFCNDCSDADIQRARPLLMPDPLAPLVTPMQTTEGKFGRIPRVYVECSRDQAIGPRCRGRCTWRHPVGLSPWTRVTRRSFRRPRHSRRIWTRWCLGQRRAA